MHYERGERLFCGHSLPDGLKKHQALPKPILTPSTKAAQGDHDVSASREEILELTKMPEEDFDRAAELSAILFAEGQKIAKERGLILVDTKYEFGKTKEGEIVVMDEIHTPDSSRYWFENTYEERFSQGLAPESFDKEFLRRFLAEQGFMGDGPLPHIPDEVRVEATLRYRTAVEQLTGEKFTPNLEDPLPRIRKNLGLSS